MCRPRCRIVFRRPKTFPCPRLRARADAASASSSVSSVPSPTGNPPTPRPATPSTAPAASPPECPRTFRSWPQGCLQKARLPCCWPPTPSPTRSSGSPWSRPTARTTCGASCWGCARTACCPRSSSPTAPTSIRRCWRRCGGTPSTSCASSTPCRTWPPRRWTPCGGCGGDRSARARPAASGSGGVPGRGRGSVRRARGRTCKEKAAFVSRRRHLVAKRTENLDERERADLETMLGYEPGLRALRDLCLGESALFARCP